MSAFAAIEMEGRFERATAAPFRLDRLPKRIWAARLRRRREWIECAAGIVTGTVAALGYAAVVPADASSSARREALERELTGLSAPLAEYAQLERAAQGAKASAAAAEALAGPTVELRSLLETLSRDVQAGVIVRRLRQSRDGYEMQVRAVDSTACASWVARLARMPAWEGAAIVDLRRVAQPKIDGGGQAGHMVEANVRLPTRVSPPASPLVPERTVVSRGEPSRRRGR